RRDGLLEEGHRIHCGTVQPGFEVCVAPRGVTCATRVRNELPLRYLLPVGHHNAAVVVVNGRQGVALHHAVGQLHAPSTAVCRVPTRVEDSTGSCSINRSTAGCTEVDAGVHVTARAIEIDGSGRGCPPAESSRDGHVAGEGVSQTK